MLPDEYPDGTKLGEMRFKLEISSLQEQLRIAREALEGIRDHEHAKYEQEECGEFNRFSGDVQQIYHDGCCDGHRCASKLAAEGLSAIDEAGKGKR